MQVKELAMDEADKPMDEAPEPGPTFMVHHKHWHVFEHEPEVHAEDHHGDPFLPGRRGVPSTNERDAAYTQDRRGIRSRPLG
jgi:hypothetical protein